MSQPNIPIVNAGVLYCNGLVIGDTGSDGNFTVSAGACRDAANLNDIEINNTVTISAFHNGALGLDVGSIVPNQIYGVYAIADSNGYQPSSVCISLAVNFKLVLPQGYDSYRRIGWVGTNGSASPATDFLKWYQFGSGQERVYYYDQPRPILIAGNATTYAVMPNTLSPSAYSMPPLNSVVILLLSYSTANSENNAQFLPFGSPAANTANPGIVRFGPGAVAGVSQDGVVEVPSIYNGTDGKSQFLYRVTNSGDSLTISSIGFYDAV